MNSIPNPSFDWNNEDKLDELKTFKRTCKYLLAGHYLKLSEHEKSIFVLIWLGKQGQKLHEELVENTDDKNSLDTLWTFLETQLTPTTNPRIFRDKRYSVVKGLDESMPDYIKRCRTMIVRCKYSDSDDQLIDQIIHGLTDNDVRFILLDDRNITFTTCLKACSEYENKQNDRKLYRTVQNIDALQLGKNTRDNKNTPRLTYTKCNYCGLNHEICPALGVICNTCGRRNHWSSVCNRVSVPKTAHAISTGTRVSSDDTRDEVFISLSIYNDPLIIKAKVDTGAQTNVLPYNIFSKIKLTPKVYSLPQLLLAYNNI